MATAQELRDRSLEELEANYEDLKKEYFELKSQQAMEKKLEKPHLLSATKKDIARVLTIIKEKQTAS